VVPPVAGNIRRLFHKTNWWACEWKIKGTGRDENKSHSWDIKVGYRWYGLPEIANTFNLAFTRQKTDNDDRGWNFHRNSCAEIEMQIPPAQFTNGVSRLTCAYGKFLPFKKYLSGLKNRLLLRERPNIADRRSLHCGHGSCRSAIPTMIECESYCIIENLYYFVKQIYSHNVQRNMKIPPSINPNFCFHSSAITTVIAEETGAIISLLEKQPFDILYYCITMIYLIQLLQF
jgi:hypothetical protein